MREIDKKLPSWNYQGQELALWHRDQHINDRGVFMDTQLAEAAVTAVEISAEGSGKTNAKTHGKRSADGNTA